MKLMGPLLCLWGACFFHLSSVLEGEFPVTSILATSFLAVVMSSLYLLIGGMIGLYWREYHKSVFSSAFEVLLVPYLAATWLFHYNPLGSELAVHVAVLFALAYALLVLSAKLRRGLLASWRDARADFQRLLSRYPMHSRFDMWMADVVYAGMLALPFVFSASIFFGA